MLASSSPHHRKERNGRSQTREEEEERKKEEEDREKPTKDADDVEEQEQEQGEDEEKEKYNIKEQKRKALTFHTLDDPLQISKEADEKYALHLKIRNEEKHARIAHIKFLLDVEPNLFDIPFEAVVDQVKSYDRGRIWHSCFSHSSAPHDMENKSITKDEPIGITSKSPSSIHDEDTSKKLKIVDTRTLTSSSPLSSSSSSSLSVLSSSSSMSTPPTLLARTSIRDNLATVATTTTNQSKKHNKNDERMSTRNKNDKQEEQEEDDATLDDLLKKCKELQLKIHSKRATTDLNSKTHKFKPSWANQEKVREEYTKKKDKKWDDKLRMLSEESRHQLKLKHKNRRGPRNQSKTTPRQRTPQVRVSRSYGMSQRTTQSCREN